MNGAGINAQNGLLNYLLEVGILGVSAFFFYAIFYNEKFVKTQEYISNIMFYLYDACPFFNRGDF